MAKRHHSSRGLPLRTEPCTVHALRGKVHSGAFSAVPLAPHMSDASLAAMCTYLTLLEKWNRVMNLVGPATWEDIFDKLIVDSFYLAACIDDLPLPDAPECRDLGAGAGLPGLPLRMLWQRGRYTLVESREKRSLFLATCLAALPLPGVQTFHGRAEAFMAENAPADLTVSRAFMPWREVLALIAPHTMPGAFCLFLTLEPLPSPLPDGWHPFGERAYTVNGQARHIWRLQKS